MKRARRQNGRLAALLFDLGDTLMVEESEIKEPDGTTLRAELLPGAAAMVKRLHRRGYRLALVADSRPNTPPNVLRQHGLLDLFEHLAISEVVNSKKPDAVMFTGTLDAMGIAREQYGAVVMIGNNLERDVVGANRLGLVSVFIQWNERRRIEPLASEELPDYTVHSIAELESLIEQLAEQPGDAPLKRSP